MNFIDAGGSRGVPTLEAAVMYNNTFAQGSTQDNYSDFMEMTPSEQNARSAVGAAINAIGFSQKLEGFKDFSNGANTWDGLDLISTKNSNNHRYYIWNSDSKSLLLKYKNDNGGGVNVAGFKYKSSGYKISATSIIGKHYILNLKGDEER